MSVCCDIEERPKSILKNFWGSPLNGKTTSLKQIRNHRLLKSIRKAMLKGEKHPLCKVCWVKEDIGLLSRRVSMNNITPDVQKNAPLHTYRNGAIDTQKISVDFLDLRFGNKCNLKCRSCGPNDSSLWMTQWLQNWDQTSPLVDNGIALKINLDKNKKNIVNSPYDWHEKSPLLKELEEDFAKLKLIYFTGGEPFINQTHWQWLEKMVKNNASSHISLIYNSNLMVLPDQAWELWPHFQNVHIAASIDGVEEYCNYLRPPSKWPMIQTNLLKLDRAKINLTLEIAPTISILNISHLPRMINWILDQKLQRCPGVLRAHLLFSPKELSIQVLPSAAKKKISHEFTKLWLELESKGFYNEVHRLKPMFESVLNHMNAEDKSHLLKEFWQEMAVQDQQNRQLLKRDLPDLYELLRGEINFSRDAIRKDDLIT